MSVSDGAGPIPQAAVVIVNYFKARRLLEGLRSLGRQSIADRIAVAVVDNSCNAEEYKLLANSADRDSFKLIKSAANVGYTKGCNLGVAALMPARYVVLCNPDIAWDDPDTLRTLIEIADANPSIGMLAPLQFSDDGAMVEISRSFPNFIEQILRRLGFRTAGEFHLTDPLLRSRESTLVDIDWVQSSCVLIRRSLWETIGGLDEKYFLFMADVDLGQLAWRAGFRVSVTSAVKVRADGIRASAGGLRTLFTSPAQRSHVIDSIRFYFSNGPRKIRRDQLRLRPDEMDSGRQTVAEAAD
jgi:N-acetylglucosaminyl-diphospho-decaprenol L-rhamnosyltransferase